MASKSMIARANRTPKFSVRQGIRYLQDLFQTVSQQWTDNWRKKSKLVIEFFSRRINNDNDRSNC